MTSINLRAKWEPARRASAKWRVAAVIAAAAACGAVPCTRAQSVGVARESSGGCGPAAGGDGTPDDDGSTGATGMLKRCGRILWSAACLQSRYGAVVLLLLSVALLLVGGGFGPISLLIAACIAASRIGKPVPWGLKHLPPGVKRSLAQLWPWVFSAALLWVPAEFALGHFLHLQNDHRQTLSNLNLLLSYPMLALFALSLITGVVHHSQSRGE